MVADTSYKAYISYSHRDEKWAKWLHRALESYNVPRKLVNVITDVGKVPARVRPVFRDRDDLPSSTDLTETVRQALTGSENLIIICSPHAAASQWVNLEIREFSELGRKQRIFCIIVDGDPAATGTSSACFPEALAKIGIKEPLAADVRQWADGKTLSKLKIISGILGLPLDQLRRRDLQKRQKFWALMTVAAITIAVILVTAVTSKITAQQRRDSGESLVASKLSELRTMLNITDDPEDLRRLSQWNPVELDGLIKQAGEGEDALVKFALHLRTQGNDYYSSGALTRALTSYLDSWALLAESYRRDSNNQVTFFELGQAEFYIGQVFIEQGELGFAEHAFMSYAEITRRLILSQPENAEWVLEMAFVLNNLGVLQARRDANNPERHLQLMQSALEYNRIALILDPKNEYYKFELGQSYAFLADAQSGVCDLEGALQSRNANVQLEQEILETDTQNTLKMSRLAFAISGYAVVKEQTGNVDEAISNLQRSVGLMKGILLQTPSDKRVIRYILERKNRIAILYLYNGSVDKAWKGMEVLNQEWQMFYKDGISDTSFGSEEYTEYLIGRAGVASSRRDFTQATSLLDQAIERISKSLTSNPGSRSAEALLIRASFLYWEMNEVLPAESTLSLLPDFRMNSGRDRGCYDAHMAFEQAIVFGEFDRAQEFSDYLVQQGYKQPEFTRECNKFALCEDQQ